MSKPNLGQQVRTSEVCTPIPQSYVKNKINNKVKLLSNNAWIANKHAHANIFLSNTYFTLVVQQPYGYNVTGQLQEPKDLIRPATTDVVF
jgi:hypothetical protein